MKKLLCLLLTIIFISLAGCGSSNVDNNTDILVNEAGSEEKNASEMQEPMENTGEEVTESKESVPETKYISIDLLEAEEIHAEGDAVEPLKLKILSEEKNGINWANDWYESKNLSLPMIGNNWDHFYDDEYEYQWVGKEYQWLGEQLNIYEKETGNCLYVLEYPTDKWYVNGNNAYIEDGIFYGASVANGYANPGSCFMFAYDLNKDELLWRSADQSYNTMNFIVKGDVIICGYGFTDEKDYLYQINKNTGEIIDKMELRKQPDLLVEQDGKLYVHAYSYDYVIDILEDTAENPQKETQEDMKNQPDLETGFSFSEFKNLNFTFLSGAGGWSTQMTIAEDGTFDGVYSDSDMGSYTNSYPKGVQYYCSFHGKFSEPVRKEEFIYSTTIESISYDYPAGTEEIKDEIRYIYSDAYGLDDPREILIYLPGMPIEELPEGYLSWVRNNWFMDSEFTKTETKLPFYGLYNVNSEQGFSSYDIFEELKETVDFTEEWVESLESSIMNDNLSQAEINEKSQLMYEFWDGQLNKAWRILKENLDADTMKVLTQEQLDWIAMKEASMKEAGAEVEGGSMYSMVVNQRGAELTKERVYELMEIVDDCIK